MARRTPDARLESRESRSRLASRGKPHYRLLEPGLHIGYRRLKGRNGKPAWQARGSRATMIGRQATLLNHWAVPTMPATPMVSGLFSFRPSARAGALLLPA